MFSLKKKRMRLNPISDEIQQMITLSGSFGMGPFISKFPTNLIFKGKNLRHSRLLSDFNYKISN